MGIEDSAFLRSMISMCEDGWLYGWHERNAGNLSYRLSEEDLEDCMPFLQTSEQAWQPLPASVRSLAGSFFAITGAGRVLREAREKPGQTFGIVEISSSGDAFRIVWGLEGGKPTSEFPTHLIAHEARCMATNGMTRVVYHAHCPNVISLSNMLPPDSKTWTKTLWKTMTEAILFFPEGLGVVPWMVPGGLEIAAESGSLLKQHAACVWTQHGLFATGQDCASTFGLAHMIEKTAGIYLQAKSACGGSEPPYYVDDCQLRMICCESGVVPNSEYLG